MSVLFIGLDGCDPTLARTWAAEGLLPVTRALFERGMCGETQNPPGLFVGAVWPSICTGVSPARHGWYSDPQLRSGSYDFYNTNHPDFIRREPFWHALGRAGRRVAAIDFPHTQAVPLNGIQVVEWGAHDPVVAFQTWPPGLASELVQRFGTHPVEGNCDLYRKHNSLERLHGDLLRAVEAKADLVIHLLGREAWDFFGTVFCESHCVGHQCWRVHDPQHPQHDRAEAERMGDPVRDVYVALDRALGRILAAADPSATVVVLWSHGMGPHYDGNHLLEEVLYRWDVGPRRVQLRQVVHPIRAPLGRLKRRLLGQLLPTSNRLGEPSHRNPHFARRRCWAVPNYSVCGAIRINLVGREPHGRIRPGRECAALVEELRADLLRLVDPDSGAPLVRDVYRVTDHYAGESLDELPDLIVEWRREREIGAAYSERTGVVRLAYDGQRTGDHTPRGCFAITGPGVQPGRLAATIDSVDLAPTMAAWLGVALNDVDGRPLSAAIPALLVRPA
jgi:predicted AlkP superfamily phosphohydrolase/phosphomutase